MKLLLAAITACLLFVGVPQAFAFSCPPGQHAEMDAEDQQYCVNDVHIRCKPGYKVRNGVCKPICKPGYYLSNGRCKWQTRQVSACPRGTTYAPSLRQCITRQQRDDINHDCTQGTKWDANAASCIPLEGE